MTTPERIIGRSPNRLCGAVLAVRSCDAEGRIVSLSGQGISVQFTYDGDGKRVKSTINGTSTYFVGGYYEVTGSTVTKYYYAGSQRVAMREGGTPFGERPGGKDQSSVKIVTAKRGG